MRENLIITHPWPGRLLVGLRRHSYLLWGDDGGDSAVPVSPGHVRLFRSYPPGQRRRR